MGQHRLSLPAGIVLGIDVVELHRRHAMDLDYHVATGHYVVVHVGIEIGEAARRKTRHAVLIEAIAHAKLKRPGDHGNVFAFGMPMRCDPISVRHLQTDSVVPASSKRIAL